jgi:hypothetical protein
LRITSRVFARSAVTFGATLALAGCGGAGLDYGTYSISTTACTGFTPALVSPANNATNVPPSTSTIELSVTPATSPLAATPSNYQLVIDDTVTGDVYYDALTVTSAPATGAVAGDVYLKSTITSPVLPLAPSRLYYIGIYNTSSTCEVKDFAGFTTGTS